MRYCAAAETGYEKISGKSSAVFLPKDNQEAPISLEYVLFDAQPTEVTSIITSVVELRNKWYEMPATVNTEQKGDTTKNPQQPAKRSKRS